jgi:hypothetical protein
MQCICLPYLLTRCVCYSDLQLSYSHRSTALLYPNYRRARLSVCWYEVTVFKKYKQFTLVLDICGGRHSVAGIATRYEMDGTGVRTTVGKDIRYPSTQAPRVTQPPVQEVLPGLFPERKTAGAWR